MISIFNILSKTQEELIDICANELLNDGYKENYIQKEKEFVFAQGEIPIMLVAHLDTVHKNLPEIYFDRNKQVIWSPDGIGGDDRCGVYAILKICENLKPYVLFTTNEEKGGTGALAFNECYKEVPLNKYINFIIEIDRRGKNQAVFYKCNNKDFQDYILSFEFTKEHGTFTDISYIAPQFDIASVNVSAGYMKEHTTTEHIFLNDLNSTINKVTQILNDTSNHKYYDFQELKYERTYKLDTNNLATYLPKHVAYDYEDLSNDDWYKYYGFAKPSTLEKLNEIWWSCWDTYE